MYDYTSGTGLLRGKLVYLDAPRAEDMPTSAKWMSDLDITYYLWTSAVRPMPLAEEKAWFAKRDTQSTFTFYIRTVQTDTLIGQITLNNYDPRNRSAGLGVAIGEKDYQSKGYGSEAMSLILDYGFLEMNLNRIELTVSDFNERAIHVYRKLGFQVEGVLRQMVFRDGRYHDVLLMSILREEWL